MGNVVNLNRFKKNKARAEKEKSAAENRAKFGRTKAQRTNDENGRSSADKLLDGHQIDPTTPKA
ncbi:MAG: DUF4169 family protein [Pseudomonadota bacterium]